MGITCAEKIHEKNLGLLGSDRAYHLPDDKRNGKPFERRERDIPITRTFDEFENFGLLFHRFESLCGGLVL